MMPISQLGPLDSLSDPELIRKVVERHQEALSELYERYSGTLLALSYRVLANLGDAEEVLQEVFVHVWNQAERYDSTRSSVSTWLVLIARSRAIDRLRSRKVFERTLDGAHKEKPEEHTSPEGAETVLVKERRTRVRQEMQNLPPEQRRILEMTYYRGMTQSEIAEQTGIPLGTVKTRTLLAMRKLRKALRDEIRELL